MISNCRKKLPVFLLMSLAFLASFALAFTASLQTDPFYLRLLEKAQKSFLARDYAEAAQNFEIAAFGLNQDTSLQAKAYFYLGLCHFYLRDSEKSAGFLRQAAGLLGIRSLAELEVPDSVLADLETLLTFFDIQLAVPLENVDSPPTQEDEKQAEASGSPRATEKESQQTAKKDSQADNKKNPGSTPPITLDKIKEGDIIALEMVDTLPVATKRIPAVYPSSVRASGITGSVTVNALISEEGSVIKTEIIQGITEVYGLNQAAVQAVSRWKFEPATIKGIKVKVWMPIRIVFKK